MQLFHAPCSLKGRAEMSACSQTACAQSEAMQLTFISLTGCRGPAQAPRGEADGREPRV